MRDLFITILNNQRTNFSLFFSSGSNLNCETRKRLFYFANNGCLSDSSTKAIIGMSIAMGSRKYHLQNRAYHQYVPLIHNRVLPFQIGIAHRKLPQFEILIVPCCLEHYLLL
jgi:hypothetical protein